MDRNHTLPRIKKTLKQVALLAEGVDRNLLSGYEVGWTTVALLAEGVDRNDYWKKEGKSVKVALLAEGVDRNIAGYVAGSKEIESPSSRRAWIEITTSSTVTSGQLVALLAEGVDRNMLDTLHDSCYDSRPPRGGRG